MGVESMGPIDPRESSAKIAQAAREAESASMEDGKCSSCGAENRDIARFCAQCGNTFMSGEQIEALES